MFWEEDATQTILQTNSLQQLLSSKDDVTLSEALDDPFLLQELRQNNPKVVALLTTNDNIVELTRKALQPEIDQQLPLEQHYTQSNLCTEILTVSSVNEIMEAFIQNEDCLTILDEVLEDPEKFNSVLAIFYTKIFSTMMSKNFAAALDFMKETDFLEKSRHFLKFGAIADLLECLIRLNNDEEEMNKLREFLVEEEFIPKLLSLFNEESDVAIHENVADVFIDVLRNLREMLAVNCEKTDALHDIFLEEATIKNIMEQMFKKEVNGKEIEVETRASLVMNGMMMLSALIENNTPGTTPNMIYENGEEPTNWIGGGPGEIRPMFERPMWLPDTEKIAETLVAQRTADMVKVAIEDLETEAPGNCWVWMLKLLGELANTNHLPTHQLLVSGFREADFKKLFTLARKHPLVHIFHHQLRNIVAYSLFSHTGETVSPLINYFLSDCDLFSVLKEGVYPLSDVPKITMYSIRSFHIYLAEVICKAIRKAHHGDLIEEYIKKSTEWSGDGEKTVAKGLNIYWKKNRPDDLKSAAEIKAARFQPPREFPEDIDAFSNFECVPEISELDAVNIPMPEPLLANFHAETAVPQGAIQLNLRDKDPQEEIFEDACQFISSDPFLNPLPLPKTKITLERKTSESRKISWPGEETTNTNNTTTTAAPDDFWSQSPAIGRLSNGSNSSDDWPSLDNSSEKDDSFKEMNGADFANFENATISLNDSGKAVENVPDIWEKPLDAPTNWVADFSQASPATSSPDTGSLNESEA